MHETFEAGRLIASGGIGTAIGAVICAVWGYFGSKGEEEIAGRAALLGAVVGTAAGAALGATVVQ
jgi:hypothetical protein